VIVVGLFSEETQELREVLSERVTARPLTQTLQPGGKEAEPDNGAPSTRLVEPVPGFDPTGDAIVENGDELIPAVQPLTRAFSVGPAGLEPATNGL
jgi:hypothetical protein